MAWWSEFILLFAAAIVGAAAVVPYSLRLAQGRALRFSKTTLFVLSLVQNAVIFAFVIWLGLLAAHALGFGAPYLESLLAGIALPPLVGLMAGMLLGAAAGAVLLIADLFFEPYWPQPLRDASLQTTVIDNLLASLYGGINEELLMRLFGFSALVWLAAFLWHPTALMFWIANIVMTILFGLGHLPALKSVIGSLPGLMVVRSLLLNAPIGLLCGWLFWTYGIESAILAHFFADIVYHVIGTIILRRRVS